MKIAKSKKKRVYGVQTLRKKRNNKSPYSVIYLVTGRRGFKIQRRNGKSPGEINAGFREGRSQRTCHPKGGGKYCYFTEGIRKSKTKRLSVNLEGCVSEDSETSSNG